jgi:hypothetical protein
MIFPYGKKDKEEEYPFPVLSSLPHYGDWPDKPDEPDEPDVRVLGVVYYEEYKTQEEGKYTYGLFGLDENDKRVNSLNDDKVINRTGYGIVLQEGDTPNNYEFRLTPNTSETSLSGILDEGIQIRDDDTLSLYPFKEATIKEWYGKVKSNTTSHLYVTKNSKTKIYKINVLYGAAVGSGEGLLGTKDEPFQLRTREHLEHLDTNYAPYWLKSPDYYFNQTRNIDINSNWISLNITMKFAIIDGGYNKDGEKLNVGESYKIYNLDQPLIDQDGNNPFTLQNLHIEKARLDFSGESYKSYGILMNSSVGSIINCTVNASEIIVEKGNAAGLVGIANYNSSALIGNTISGCTIISRSNTSAGLVFDGSGADIINNTLEDCFITSDIGAASGLMDKTSYTYDRIISTNHLTNCVIEGKTEAVGLIRDLKGSVNDCKIIACNIKSTNGNASGFVSSTQYTINNSSISNSIIEAPKGSAVGIIQTYTKAEYNNLEKIEVNNCRITGSSAAGFANTNLGVINECTVVSSENSAVTNIIDRIEESCGIYGNTEAAGFINTNSGGNIQNSHVISIVEANVVIKETNTDVIEEIKAAGFVGINSSTIEKCYYSGTVEAKAVTDESSTVVIKEINAAGFVIETKSAITNCYVVGSIHGTTKAAGFVLSYPDYSTNLLSYCYTAANVKADTNDSYAFAPKDNKEDYFSECYYLAPPDFIDVKSVGNPVIYGNLTITGLGWVGPGLDSIWEQKKATQESPNPYPFPQLKKLPHEGSWPLPPS